MTNIAFRISLPFADVNLDELYALCDSVAIYEHPQDATVKRTHIHGLLIGCKRKEDTIRNRFFKGKYEYSFKTTYQRGLELVPVDMGFITYMAKGIHTAVHIRNISPDEISHFTALWGVKKPQNILVSFEGHLISEPLESKKKLTKRKLVEIMMIKYNPRMDNETVLLLIREVLIAHNEVLGRWKCMDFYDALLMYADADRWMDGILYQINKRDKKT